MKAKHLGGSLLLLGVAGLAFATGEAVVGLASQQMVEVAAPGTPPSGTVVLYAKTDGLLYSKDDAGAETQVSGGGSGTPFVAWSASSGVAPISTTSFATFDTRNGHGVLDFDDSVDEEIIFAGEMHPDYSGGTLTVTITWTSEDQTSGDAQWAVAFERIGTALDIDSDSFASERTSADTTNGTTGIATQSTITFTQAQADSVAAGERFRLKLRRAIWSGSPDNNLDTMTNDAEVLGVSVQE